MPKPSVETAYRVAVAEVQLAHRIARHLRAHVKHRLTKFVASCPHCQAERDAHA